MFFRVVCVITAIFCTTSVWPQKTEQPGYRFNQGKSIPDGHTIMFSADYASNTNVLGNFNTGVKQPSYSPSLTYFSMMGLDLSMLGYVVGHSDDSLDHFTSELDIMLGYTFEPVKNLFIYPGYSHFMYGRNSNSLKSLFSDDFHLDVDYCWKMLDLGLSAGYFTGRQHTFYAQVRGYLLLDLEHVFFRNGILSLLPGIDANFGDYEYLNLYYLDQLRNNSGFSGYLIMYPAFRRYVFSQKLRNPDLTREEILYQFLRENARDSFKFTSLGINLPVSYMIGNFGLNLGLYAFIPVNQPDYLDDGIQFFFNIGLNYMLTFR